MNKDEERGLIEKRPNIFERIFYFLFVDSSIEDEYEEYEENIAAEEVKIIERNINNFENDFDKNVDIEETEYDDVSDYSKDEIEKIQQEYESGAVDLDVLSVNQVNLLFTIYMEQIKEISKSNENKKKILLEYRDSMSNN